MDGRGFIGDVGGGEGLNGCWGCCELWLCLREHDSHCSCTSPYPSRTFIIRHDYHRFGFFPVLL